jgi:hypothetical protein
MYAWGMHTTLSLQFPYSGVMAFVKRETFGAVADDPFRLEADRFAFFAMMMI